MARNKDIYKCDYCGYVTNRLSGSYLCPKCGHVLDPGTKYKKAGHGRGCFTTFLIVIGVIVFTIILVLFVNRILSPGNAAQDEKTDLQANKTITPVHTVKPKASAKPSSTPLPSPTFEPVSGTAGDWEIIVTDFNYMQSISAGLLREYRANDGSKFCTVNITVKNIGKKAQIFLPYISYGNSATAYIVWDGYEYIRSELLWSDEDTLSNESLNPLVSASGMIVFEVPDEMILSDIPPVLQITENYQVFHCELVKE